MVRCMRGVPRHVNIDLLVSSIWYENKAMLHYHDVSV